MKLYFDAETYSECNLKTAGVHRYAEDPSTEIIVVQWAVEDGPPTVLDCTAPLADPRNREKLDLITHYLRDPNAIIVAHKSDFDRTIVRHCWGLDIPPERWQDTLVKAHAHSLPGALEKVGTILGLPDDEAKDKRGKQLIQLFCKPRPKGSKVPRATREAHPVEWAEFLEYSRQDIIAMRVVDQRLPKWNYSDGKPELSLWHLDQRINDRGIAVDLDLAHAALTAVEADQRRLKARVSEATDGLVSSASKRDDMLAFILAEYGVDLPDMKADTLRRRMEDPELPEGVKLLLALRLEATKTSTAKYKALLNAVSADGRLRGTMQFGGAMRTLRWSHRLFQPGNMPRTPKWFDAATQELTVAAIKSGAAVVAGDVMAATSNAIRGCIIAPPGRKLVVADLANIEGRGLAWLADEAWKLRAFADYDYGIGPDLYNVAYGRAFNVDPMAIDKLQRQIGKVMELGLGYEGGVAAFLTFAAVYQMDLQALADAVHSTVDKGALADAYRMHEWATKKGMRAAKMDRSIFVACEVLKAAWRAAHPATTQLWADAKQGFVNAIKAPSVTFDIGRHLRVQRDGQWLRLRLPSGRYLCYLQPKLDDGGQITYAGVNQYTRQWARIKTYGGKIIENATQALARDVLAANMPEVERRGYDIVLSVHDELVTETPDDARYSSHELASIMATVPPWARGLPLAAAGFETQRYRKD